MFNWIKSLFGLKPTTPVQSEPIEATWPFPTGDKPAANDPAPVVEKSAAKTTTPKKATKPKAETKATTKPKVTATKKAAPKTASKKPAATKAAPKKRGPKPKTSA